MINGFKVFDIREKMRDSQNPIHIKSLAEEAPELLGKHDRIVVCCSAGVSRSNSIAIAILMKQAKMTFEEAYKLVQEKVPIADPLSCHLDMIRN